MKGSKHRVLFQNADGNINMGVCFSNKETNYYDLFWYSIVANMMQISLERNEGLITVDEKRKIKSGFVELHRQAFKIT